MKIFIIITFAFFFSLPISAQIISYKDLVGFADETTQESAQKLYRKGFTQSWRSDGGSSVLESVRTYTLSKIKTESISINFERWKLGYEDITGCFPLSFNNEFKYLKSMVSKNLKQTRDFYDEDGKFFYTEYILGDKYLYFTRGLCETDKTFYKQGTFIIRTTKM